MFSWNKKMIHCFAGQWDQTSKVWRLGSLKNLSLRIWVFVTKQQVRSTFTEVLFGICQFPVLEL
jgi:hypothetical protein